MEKLKRGMLIILSGPSGVGKGTVREELFKDEFEVIEAHIKLMQDIQDELAPSEND